jgi:prepilin-type N-terminal cleavage/methylation domain-containing protein
MPNEQRKISFTMSRATTCCGFTLVEVMVSLALMVVLMLAVNYIFSTVGKATGAAQALSRTTRDAQSAQAIMFRDFAAADMKNAPFILLRSESVPAFRNQTDRLSGPDFGANPDPLWVNKADGTGSFQTSTALYDDRNHRTDVFSFFSRDTFQRQTGGGTMSGGVGRVDRFVDPMTCQEAWVWYGHVLLPDNGDLNATPPIPPSFIIRGTGVDSGKATTPGSGDFKSNPNNYYASQFTLGRFAMLLQDPDSTTKAIRTSEKVTSVGAPVTMDHIYVEADRGDGISFLWPFSYDSQTSVVGDTATTLQQSRYDLAGTSMGSYRTYLLSFQVSNSGADWWDKLMLAYRYQASPFILNVSGTRLTPAAVAKQSPIFLSGCSQFIVEYAGDFIAQDNDVTQTTYGQIVNTYYDLNDSATPPAPATDGEVDYILDWNDDGDNLIQPAELPSVHKRVRWYGLPRDLNGDGVILGGTSTLSNFNSNALKDVVPLRDVILSGNKTSSLAATSIGTPVLMGNQLNGAPFERFVNYVDPVLPATSPLQLQDKYVTKKLKNEFYTCAWGPGDRRPSMIRVTFVLDDPEGQLGQPQTFEYIFKVQ